MSACEIGLDEDVDLVLKVGDDEDNQESGEAESSELNNNKSATALNQV